MAAHQRDARCVNPSTFWISSATALLIVVAGCC